MISFAEVDSLPNELYESVRQLHERSHTIWDLPEDLGKIEAWDELIRDAERLGYPNMTATGLYGRHVTFVQAGMAADALDAYLRLMQLIHRHGEHIDPRKVAIDLDGLGALVSTCADDPAIALDQITRVIDLVEQQSLRLGADVAGVYFARATVAAARGDREATLQWLERMRAAGSATWRPDYLGIIQMEIPLIAEVDPVLAAQVLEQRIRLIGADLDRLSADDPDADSYIRLFTLRAFQLAGMGRSADADVIMSRLVGMFGIDEVVKQAIVENSVRALENHPDWALYAVDFGLRDSSFDHDDWRVTAAAARSRLLADPHGEEGRLLRALAEDGARAHDERGATTKHAAELTQLWWAGLPDLTRPEITANPEIWDDTEERAELILRAGWLDRVGAVSADDPPIAIKYQYVNLLGSAMGLLETETIEETETLAGQLRVRADELRCATTRFAVPLLYGLRVAQLGRAATLVTEYRRAQDLLLEAPELVPGYVAQMAERTFAAVVRMAVITPEVSWEQIGALLDEQTRITELIDGVLSPLLLARAEVAAHLDQAQELQRWIGMLQQRLAEEAEQLDPAEIDVETIRLTAFYSADFARQLARRVIDAGSAEQVRAATLWDCWLRVRTNVEPDNALQQAVGLLIEHDFDTDVLGMAPDWVLLELAARAGLDIPKVVTRLVEQNDGTPLDLEFLAAAGSALSASAPQDPRAAQFRADARKLAEALGARNGNDFWAVSLGQRYFGGDREFGLTS